jgi:tRNA nucleotidyltransferase/poly(A) polymerase
MKNEIKQILREKLIMEQRIKFNIPIPEDIMELNHIFKRNGFDLLIVGGAVRDSILGKPIKDYDLVTNAMPDKVEELMSQNGIKTLATGKSFGVINVFTDEGEYEVATMRSDGSGRKPEVNLGVSIKTDSQRRDLSINALYYDIDKSEIIDLVGGVNDIKNGVIRTVGAPEDRFSEDKLRIMRAIRFAGRFGKTLDPATDAALQKDASLEGISGERIRDEFVKGLQSSKSTVHFLQLLDKYGLFYWIFKGLNVDKRVIQRLQSGYKYDDYLVVIARLLKNNTPDEIKRVLNGLKYPTDEAKAIAFLVAMLKLDVNTAVTLKKAQETAGVSPDQIRKFGADEGISSQLLDAFEEFKLSVSGPEVMDKYNLKPSPEVGQKIQQIETDNFKKLL